MILTVKNRGKKSFLLISRFKCFRCLRNLTRFGSDNQNICGRRRSCARFYRRCLTAC